VGTHRGGGTKWGGGERPTRWHSPSVRVMWWSLKLRGGMGKVSHRSIEAGMGRGRCSREDRRRGVGVCHVVAKKEKWRGFGPVAGSEVHT
jgi:hypothetical protein